jgi:hypothetical protein
MQRQLSIHLISGAPRSGTTLLQAILSHSVGSNQLIGEARFIRRFLEFYREVNRIWDDDAKYYFVSREFCERVPTGPVHDGLQQPAYCVQDRRSSVLCYPVSTKLADSRSFRKWSATL